MKFKIFIVWMLLLVAISLHRLSFFTFSLLQNSMFISIEYILEAEFCRDIIFNMHNIVHFTFPHRGVAQRLFPVFH